MDIAPITKGSEKQIAWATDIKTKAFANHEAALVADLDTFQEMVYVTGPDHGKIAGLSRRDVMEVQGFRDPVKSKYAAAFAAADAELAANDDARYWIDNRDESIQHLAKNIVRSKEA